MTTQLNKSVALRLPPRIPKKEPKLECARSAVQFRHWSERTDDGILDAAQVRIDEHRFESFEAFAAVYKGIAAEIVNRPTLAKTDLKFHPKGDAPKSDVRIASPGTALEEASDEDIFVITKEQIRRVKTVEPDAGEEESKVSKLKFVDWRDRTDEGILEAAQEKITENGFESFGAFAIVYKAIAAEIIERGLPRDDLVYKRKVEDWNSLEEEDVLVIAQEKVRLYRINDPDEFAERYRGINLELHKRGLSARELNYGDS